jgi:hypothetical protein
VYLNPGPTNLTQPWTKQALYSGLVANESPADLNLTGEAKKELVFMTNQQLGYARPGATTTAPWTFTAVSGSTSFGTPYVHGLGVGDVDGDGAADLSTSRIYYAGQSFGGIYGVQLLGLEPDIRAGVPNVPGGPIIEIARLSPSFRILVGLSLLSRTPSLYNAVPNAGLDNFIENIPLRNLPLVVDTVSGASAIQTLIDNSEWAQQAANPAAYAPFVNRGKTIIQFARGDKTVPNPTTSAILRAGNLAPRATLFRNDLAYTASAGAVGKNPHTFLTNIAGAGAGYALAAQAQIATFFATDGTLTIDPDGPGPFFETPTSMVPEDLAYIQ